LPPLGWEHIIFNGDYVWPSEPLKEGVSAAAKSALRLPRCRLERTVWNRVCDDP
jgi:hypothetical protein